MGTFDEKRRFARVESRFPLKYRDLKETTQETKGTVSKNVSEGGVRFRSDRFISLATRLVVELNIPAADKPVRAVSKITWIKKLPVGDDYEVGNQFLEISKQDRELIRYFIKKQLESSPL